MREKSSSRESGLASLSGEICCVGNVSLGIYITIRAMKRSRLGEELEFNFFEFFPNDYLLMGG